MDDSTDQNNVKTPLIRPTGDASADMEATVDDVEIESYNDDATSEGSMTLEDKIKRLREKLRVCEREKAANLDGWQRSKADFVNYRKREEDGKAEFLKFAGEGVVTDLLPVLQSFHMAFANKEAWGKVDPSWRKGVEHIHTQLVQVLHEHGLTEVDPAGQNFDPNEHMSVGLVPTEDKGLYHKVAEVLQLGYRLNGKLIRSPQVKVYGGSGDATFEPETE